MILRFFHKLLGYTVQQRLTYLKALEKRLDKQVFDCTYEIYELSRDVADGILQKEDYI